MIERQEKHNPLRQFPEGFKFGAAVAPYQVEGNVTEERHNDWDSYFEINPQDIPFRKTEIGPNWWTYPNAEEDIDRLKSLGLNALSFGIEWGRVEPKKGTIDQNAIRRYRQIIDYVKSLGLTPLVTLNHFTLPDWIGNTGGYSSPEFAPKFKEYADRIADNFGDVTNWLTLNEPTITILNQYAAPNWPPREQRASIASTVLENMRRANGLVYDSLKKIIPQSQVGSAHTMIWFEPIDKKSESDKAAVDALNFDFNLGPMKIVTDNGDAADFIGYNYYTGYFVKPTSKHVDLTVHDEGLGVLKTVPPNFEVILPAGYKSDTGWPISPEFFLHSLQYLKSNFPDTPIEITENGIADKVDKYRGYYILTHLATIREAIARGIDIKGYYYWSLVDNLEWMSGYDYKFGLIDLNPETGVRNTRESAHLYEEIARSGEIDVVSLARRYLTPEQGQKATKFSNSL